MPKIEEPLLRSIAAQDFGRQLEETRREAKLTQRELAQKTAGAASQGFISRIERGLENPTLATCESLMEALGRIFFTGSRPLDADTIGVPSPILARKLPQHLKNA